MLPCERWRAKDGKHPVVPAERWDVPDVRRRLCGCRRLRAAAGAVRLFILSTPLTSLRMGQGDDLRHVSQGDLMSEPHESSLTREYGRTRSNPKYEWHRRPDWYMWLSVRFGTVQTSIFVLPGLVFARCVQLDRRAGVRVG